MPHKHSSKHSTQKKSLKYYPFIKINLVEATRTLKILGKDTHIIQFTAQKQNINNNTN